MLCGLDLDGVLCDIGPSVARRISDRFGVASHPSTWRSYDLRLLRLGVPEDRLGAFLDDTFDDPALYAGAPVCDGVATALGELRRAGWRLVGITARPTHLAGATQAWLARHRLPVDEVHHTPVGTKSAVARRLGADATIEDNPTEAELLADVCDSWLLDRPYNRSSPVARARRLASWDDAVGRLCQLRLFA
ncbi:MAG: 5' nucleotidase, NT5C type [Acidimicrobiales bacterium]